MNKNQLKGKGFWRKDFFMLIIGALISGLIGFAFWGLQRGIEKEDLANKQMRMKINIIEDVLEEAKINYAQIYVGPFHGFFDTKIRIFENSYNELFDLNNELSRNIIFVYAETVKNANLTAGLSGGIVFIESRLKTTTKDKILDFICLLNDMKKHNYDFRSNYVKYNNIIEMALPSGQIHRCNYFLNENKWVVNEGDVKK